MQRDKKKRSERDDFWPGYGVSIMLGVPILALLFGTPTYCGYHTIMGTIPNPKAQPYGLLITLLTAIPAVFIILCVAKEMITGWCNDAYSRRSEHNEKKEK